MNKLFLILSLLCSSASFAGYDSKPVSVSKGGTSLSTLTAHAIYAGNATAAPTPIAPGTSGNVLQSNGTDWVSTAPSAATYRVPTITKLTSTGTATGKAFEFTTANLVAGDTYTNNGNTYTVKYTKTAASFAMMTGTGTISGSTLTRSSGTGSASITITSSRNTATYTVPSAPAPTYIKIRVIGAGGGGGGSGNGSGNGATGGASYFANIKALGGFGGGGSTTTVPGFATTSIQEVILQSTSFFTEIFTIPTLVAVNGATNLSANNLGPNGAIGPNGGDAYVQTTSAMNNGSGGVGSAGTATIYPGSGGNSGSMEVAVSSTIQTSYPYAIGTGGAGGAAGTSGNGGGNGTDGIIFIEEYYQ